MSTKLFAISALSVLLLSLGAAAQAQDAMSPEPMMDSMAGDAMSMMSDEDLAMCLEQAKSITFSEVAMVAEKACHDLHNGHDAMGGDAMMSTQ